MGILNWVKNLFVGKNEIHIYLHVDGSVDNYHHSSNVDTRRATTSDKPAQVDKKNDIEMEPSLGDIQIPTIDFGEEVKDE